MKTSGSFRPGPVAGRQHSHGAELFPQPRPHFVERRQVGGRIFWRLGTFGGRRCLQRREHGAKVVPDQRALPVVGTRGAARNRCGAFRFTPAKLAQPVRCLVGSAAHFARGVSLRRPRLQLSFLHGSVYLQREAVGGRGDSPAQPYVGR